MRAWQLVLCSVNQERHNGAFELDGYEALNGERYLNGIQVTDIVGGH